MGGELTAELPFVLMHPKPNMRKIIKADTLAEVEGFQVRKNAGNGCFKSAKLFFFAYACRFFAQIEYKNACI